MPRVVEYNACLGSFVVFCKPLFFKGLFFDKKYLQLRNLLFIVRLDLKSLRDSVEAGIYEGSTGRVFIELVLQAIWKMKGKCYETWNETEKIEYGYKRS